MVMKSKSWGIGGNTREYQGRTDDWITPQFILEALGPFDLDPCCSATQPWETAENSYTIDDDGFNKEWLGRVWLNPPYGPETGKWIGKLAEHNHGTTLIFARTETKMFFDHVWNHANSILFLKGRLYFHYPDGTKAKHNSGGPSVLIAYGKYDTIKLMKANKDGLLEGRHVFL